jgi:hypothetical protein
MIAVSGLLAGVDIDWNGHFPIPRLSQSGASKILGSKRKKWARRIGACEARSRA